LDFLSVREEHNLNSSPARGEVRWGGSIIKSLCLIKNVSISFINLYSSPLNLPSVRGEATVLPSPPARGGVRGGGSISSKFL